MPGEQVVCERCGSEATEEGPPAQARHRALRPVHHRAGGDGRDGRSPGRGFVRWLEPKMAVQPPTLGRPSAAGQSHLPGKARTGPERGRTAQPGPGRRRRERCAVTDVVSHHQRALFVAFRAVGRPGPQPEPPAAAQRILAGLKGQTRPVARIVTMRGRVFPIITP